MFNNSGDVCRKKGSRNFMCPNEGSTCRQTHGPPYCEDVINGGPCRIGRVKDMGIISTSTHKHSKLPSMEAKILFRKPTEQTGQLELMEEGLNVIRSQREPFGEWNDLLGIITIRHAR